MMITVSYYDKHYEEIKSDLISRFGEIEAHDIILELDRADDQYIGRLFKKYNINI